MDTKRKVRKTWVGIVVSDHKIRKTLRMEVERLVKHQLYKKYFKRTSSFLVHDEKEECRTGDRIKIMETRPISRCKHWIVVQVLEKAKAILAPLPEEEGIDTPAISSVPVMTESVESSKKEEASS